MLKQSKTNQLKQVLKTFLLNENFFGFNKLISKVQHAMDLKITTVDIKSTVLESSLNSLNEE